MLSDWRVDLGNRVAFHPIRQTSRPSCVEWKGSCRSGSFDPWLQSNLVQERRVELLYIVPRRIAPARQLERGNDNVGRHHADGCAKHFADAADEQRGGDENGTGEGDLGD